MTHPGRRTGSKKIEKAMSSKFLLQDRKRGSGRPVQLWHGRRNAVQTCAIEVPVAEGILPRRFGVSFEAGLADKTALASLVLAPSRCGFAASRLDDLEPEDARESRCQTEKEVHGVNGREAEQATRTRDKQRHGEEHRCSQQHPA
jgi:hypothetical protein